MNCYRIVHKKYADTLSGEGARLYGGRWNTKGNSMIYTAQSSSLAMLEMLVQRNIQLVGINYFLITIKIPDTIKIKSLTKAEIPVNWDANPPNVTTKSIGDSFINDGKYMMLSVPSAVNPLEYNFLINDRHPDFKEVSIIDKEQIIFDKRLL